MSSQSIIAQRFGSRNPMDVEEWERPEEIADVVIDDPVLRKGFTPMPKAVFDDDRLSVEARHIYESLLSYAWGVKDTCFPSQITLAKRMGRSVRTVYKYLCELRDGGLISWERQGLGKPNLYRILSLEAAYEPIEALPEWKPASGQEWKPASD